MVRNLQRKHLLFQLFSNAGEKTQFFWWKNKYQFIHYSDLMQQIKFKLGTMFKLVERESTIIMPLSNWRINHIREKSANQTQEIHYRTNILGNYHWFHQKSKKRLSWNWFDKNNERILVMKWKPLKILSNKNSFSNMILQINPVKNNRYNE